MEKAVIYARYSSHSQTEQSIEGQLAAGYRYAKEHDYTIVKEYCDRAKTGTNDNREAFQAMLKDCTKKAFSVIIVWKVDRFGRNREEIAFNKYHCKKNGVRVEYVAENIAPGPEGVILEAVLEGMAEYYSLQLSQNIMRGKLESAKKHLAPAKSAMPLGYKRGDDGKFAIDETSAPIVRKVFELYNKGLSKAECVRYLNDHGYRTARGGEFNKNSLGRMLSNEKYIGTYVYKDLVRDENVIPPIISKELFINVQEKLSDHRRMPAHNWTRCNFPLTGKLVCGDCGGSIVGNSGRSHTGDKYNYYVCPNRRQGKCNSSYVKQEVLEGFVFSRVRDLLSDDSLIDYLTNISWDHYSKFLEVDSETKRIESEIARVTKSYENIITSIEQGMPYATVKDRLDRLSNERQSLIEEKAKIDFNKPTIKLTKEMIKFFLIGFRDGDKDDPTLRNRLLDIFINKIFVYADRITIVFNYSDIKEDITYADLESSEVLLKPRKWRRVINVRTLKHCILMDFKFP